MKALLVAMNAKYIHSNLGIYSIWAYGTAHGIQESQLSIAEYTINQSQNEILADIYQQKPDLVAFSCYIWNIRQIQELAAGLHKVLPEVPIWLGGPEVSFDASDLVKTYPWLSGVMVGEGERTFLELFEAYTQNGTSPELDSIAGLVYAKTDCQNGLEAANRKIVVTEERKQLPMDELVFPYHKIEGLEHRIIYYETSRGCPFGCSYCLSSVERQVRFRSMELVEQELQFFLDRKVPQVKFVDRTFNCLHEHTMAIWRYIHKHDNGITNFHFELSADLLTDEEIETISKFRPGLVQFEIGVQSTNPCTIEAISRKTKLDKLKERVDKVRQAGNVHQHLDLIAGLPMEDYTSFQHSFNEVYGMKPDQLQLGFLKVLKGSPIYWQREEFGIVFQDIPPYEVLFTKWLSYEDILRLKQVEDMVERYYNSMQFEASLPYVESQFPDAFDFYQRLGEYYQEKGYMGFHQSRLQNYEILLAFSKENTQCDSKTLQQLMLYDLYARENLKARPQFLNFPITGEQKEWNRKFYQEEEKRDRYLPEYTSYDWKQTARMTHLEHFTFSVLNYLKTGKIKEGNYIVLFDYRKRNPLNNQAGTIEV